MSKDFFELRETTFTTADKKPEKYVGPDGKTKIRMVPVRKDIIKTESQEVERIREDKRYSSVMNHRDAEHAHDEMHHYYKSMKDKKGAAEVAKHHAAAASAHDKAHELIGKGHHDAAHGMASAAIAHAKKALDAARKHYIGHRDGARAHDDSLRAKEAHSHLGESVEQLGEGMMDVAKELEAYARKYGGIDKKDFMKAAMMMKKGQKKQLMKFVDELDTEPREKIQSLMQKHLKEAVGTSAKYAGKSGMFGGKYTSKDRMMDMPLAKLNKVRDKRHAQNKAAHDKQDPKMSKMGYAKHMLDVDKADAKARKRGIDPTDKYDRYKKKNNIKDSVQVDEVLDRPGALDSYRKKADDSGNRARNSATRKILQGPDKDGKRADHSDELKTMRKRNKGQDMADKVANNLFRKSIGLPYIKKESVEQIDELSQDKLRQYYGKAGADLLAKRAKAAKGQLSMADLKKGQNRVKGLNRAANKMEEKKLTPKEIKRALASIKPSKKKPTLPKAPWEKTNESYIPEGLTIGDGMGSWIKDFQASDAPQFAGKSKKHRRDMAIAAYLSAQRGKKQD